MFKTELVICLGLIGKRRRKTSLELLNACYKAKEGHGVREAGLNSLVPFNIFFPF